MSNSLQPHGLYSPWNSPGQNTGVGGLSLFQGIFPTQRLNPGLPHCRWIFYQMSHKGSPKILEWVAFPFSRGSSWPRNQAGISCTAGGFSTNWAIRGIREADSREEIQKPLGNALFLWKTAHRTLHKMKDVNHHIIHIPALPTCITTAGICSIFLSKMQSTTTIKIP